MRINPEMVILAREYRGLTQGELAERTGFSQPKIARIENGTGTDLAEGDANRLSEKLNFPLQFFQQDEVRVGFGSSSYYYRKKAALSAADRKRIQSIVNLKRIHLKRMLSAVNMEYERPFRRFELDEYSGRPESIAKALRTFWKLPDGPVTDLTAAIESAGVIILPCSFGTREMDGTSLWLGELPPLIFIRDDLPGDRWRFTLAHELGHLVMHEIPTETMEEEADRFAAELLMPEKDVKPMFARYTSLGLQDLANLKLYWKVAMTALLRRSRDLGFTSDNQARYLYQRMSSMGYRMNEPVQVEREKAKVIQQLLDCFLSRMGFTADSFAAFLRVNRDEVETIYGIKLKVNKVDRPSLRIVK